MIRSTAVPKKYVNHRLVRDQVFFTLPDSLLEALLRHPKAPVLDQKLLRVERSLSAVIGDHRSNVGFLAGRPILYCMLRERPLDPRSKEYIRQIADSADAVIKDLREQVDFSNRNIRAFSGWLMTNRVFLDEHAAVWKHIRPMVKTDGSMPQPMPPVSSLVADKFGLRPVSEQHELLAISELRRFCSRWRLERLVAPMLPMPLGQQSPSMLPVMSARQAKASGYGLIAIPDTMPLPPEKRLRKNVEAAIGEPPDHLAAWKSLISSSNSGKNVLSRYARVFELQHLYRVLMSRHGDALRRKSIFLKERFADYFEVESSTVGRDLDLIAGRLGGRWWERYPLPML